MARLCVVDDKEILRDSLSAALEREDHTVTAFADPTVALREIVAGKFDLVLADLKMPRMDGLTLIREIRSSGCDVPIIVMTAYASVATAVDAMKLGAYDYIQKPFEADTANVLVDRALEHARLRRENEALRTTVEDLSSHRQLIGAGSAMTSLQHQLDRVANSHATVGVSSRRRARPKTANAPAASAIV